MNAVVCIGCNAVLSDGGANGVLCESCKAREASSDIEQAKGGVVGAANAMTLILGALSTLSYRTTSTFSEATKVNGYVTYELKTVRSIDYVGVSFSAIAIAAAVFGVFRARSQTGTRARVSWAVSVIAFALGAVHMYLGLKTS